MPKHTAPSTARDLANALHQSAAFRRLSPTEQAQMRSQAEKVFSYLETPPQGMALAQPLTQGTEAGGNTEGGSSVINDPVREAGSVARNTLDSIDFPSFVASLVQGTFQAIVDSSIQQMEAYSQLLASVAKTVDEFMDEHITDDMARDHLANNYGSYFQKDVNSSGPQLSVAPTPTQSDSQPLPGFLQDLGFSEMGDIDEPALNETIIPATRRTLAETRHQSLATMVMMGLNRLIVNEGEINAKLVFNIDASQTSGVTFDDSKTTNWGMAGTAGRNQFGATGVIVTTTNVNTQSDVELRAELTGEVRIKFSSDYFPLERFADSAAIQLINNHAKPLPPPVQNGNGAEGDEGEENPRSATSQSLEAQPMDGKAWSVRSPEEVQ